ncbi:ASCH domain-containing protein [Methylomagnum sp.]
MSAYPPKTCEIDRLIRHPRLVEATKTGQKTQQRRDGLYAYPGETFELDGVAFTVTEVERRRLGDMTEADAQAEGYPNLAVYKDLILKMHAGMTWDEEHLVWVHHFQRVDS